MVLTALLTVSARSASSCLTVDSTLAIISVAGMPAGVTVKFRPFFSRDTSASVRDLDDRLTTQLVLSTKDVVGHETEACFSRKRFSNLHC